jgi:hypothetical protein
MTLEAVSLSTLQAAVVDDRLVGVSMVSKSLFPVWAHRVADAQVLGKEVVAEHRCMEATKQTLHVLLISKCVPAYELNDI